MTPTQKKHAVILAAAVLLAILGAYIGIVVLPACRREMATNEGAKTQKVTPTKPSESAAAQPIDPGKILSFETYSGYFVSNNFEPDAPDSFVVLKTQKAFDGVFGVAMVMNDRSHRLAEGAFASNVVLATIKRANAICEFKVEHVSLLDGVVKICYRATSKKSETASFACPLIVSIPKGAYREVEFVEIGQAVKRLPFKE
jgi:hypothetical protein